MRETPGALEKLYSMLHDAETLNLSRAARLRLIGAIGSLESEELARFQDDYLPGQSEDMASATGDGRFSRHSRH